MNVRPGLSKMEPTNAAEVLKQPVFGNPLITNQDSKPLGLSGRSEGNALVNAGHSRIGDFWDLETNSWKNLLAFGMSSHASNKLNRDLIVASIPWNPDTSSNKPRIGDWVSKKEANQTAPPEWVYQITDTNLTTASAKEFRKSSSAGRVQATNSHYTTIPFEGYEPVRVLAQDDHGTTLRLAKDLLPPGKKPPIYWIFESGFISGLPWDPGDWLWQATRNMGDAPFFGYSSKRGYRNARKKHHPPSIITFIQDLGLHNSTVAQIVARMWHNARPRKVRALTWLTLNNGLPVGTWL